jgi:hypothetical protein
MQSIFVCTISAALVLGCNSGISEPAAPFLRGVITSRAPILIGVQDGAGTRVDSIPAMFVDGRGIWPAPEPCAAQARFAIGSGTQVIHQGVPTDTAQLVVGQRVVVWVNGVVLESCPPQAGATRVVLEETR